MDPLLSLRAGKETWGGTSDSYFQKPLELLLGDSECSCQVHGGGQQHGCPGCRGAGRQHQFSEDSAHCCAYMAVRSRPSMLCCVFDVSLICRLTSN